MGFIVLFRLAWSPTSKAQRAAALLPQPAAKPRLRRGQEETTAAGQETENLMSLMASLLTTAPPTRFVV